MCAPQLATSLGSFVQGVFCYQGVPDSAEFRLASSGEGMVRLAFCPNKVLPAEHQHVFSFQVLNGVAPQFAPGSSDLPPIAPQARRCDEPVVVANRSLTFIVLN